MVLASGNELGELMIWELELLPLQLWGLEIAREFGFKQFGHQYNTDPNLTVSKVVEIGALLEKVK